MCIEKYFLACIRDVAVCYITQVPQKLKEWWQVPYYYVLHSLSLIHSTLALIECDNTESVVDLFVHQVHPMTGSQNNQRSKLDILWEDVDPRQGLQDASLHTICITMWSCERTKLYTSTFMLSCQQTKWNILNTLNIPDRCIYTYTYSSSSSKRHQSRVRCHILWSTIIFGWVKWAHLVVQLENLLVCWAHIPNILLAYFVMCMSRF